MIHLDKLEVKLLSMFRCSVLRLHWNYTHSKESLPAPSSK